MKQIRVQIHTVGCRANQSDSAVLESLLHPDRVVVGGDERPDVVVVNTCCVTGGAERDCRRLVRRFLEDDGVTVVLTGCAVSAIEGFGRAFGSRVVSVGGGDRSPSVVADWLNDFAKGQVCETVHSPAGSCFDHRPDAPVKTLPGRTRAMLKIQNGCRHHCTYCIVPRARGPEESMPQDILRRRVSAFREAGVRELVLTGIQLGAWGIDLPGRPSLGDAVRTAAAAFAPGRIRLSSVEPWSVDDPLVRAVADTPNVCPHFHIPLQSGDDGVLRDMGRGYTVAAYLEKLALIRAAIPGAAIGTDVLCGFPTESEEAFENTLAVMRAAAFSHVHGFSYSRRPGTRATALYGAGDRTSARRRVQRVRSLGDTLAADFQATQIGRCCDVLVEENGRGLTDTFVSVRVDGAPQGALVPCHLKINERAHDLLWADPRDL